MFTEVFGFQSFSAEHAFVVSLFIIFGIGSIYYGRKVSDSQATRMGRAIGWAIFGVEVLWLLHKMVDGSFKMTENLPLDLCNILALMIPVVMMRRYEWLFQIAYYWVLTGTLQGVLTPDLDWAFPYIGYLKYWGVHAGLVVAVLYAALVYRWAPSLRGILIAYGAIQIWAAMVFGLNLLLNANYGYLMRKPPVASLFDLFGKHYILVAQGVCLSLFFVFWLPFGLKSYRANKAFS
jgi:hypothetical integral membrane protein (TIGR02206 family)